MGVMFRADFVFFW